MAKNEWMLMSGGLLGLLILMLFLRRPQEITPTAAPPPMEVQRRIWEQIEAPPGVPVVPTMPTNACGSTRFGYPDFSGTPREGQKSVDDWDCQTHSPVGFPYYQQCCVEDGTCFT